MNKGDLIEALLILLLGGILLWALIQIKMEEPKHWSSEYHEIAPGVIVKVPK